MSVTVPQWMVQQFSTNVHYLAEQKMSKLRDTVQDEPDMTGEAKACERLGTTQDAPDQITTRHGDTPVGNTEHSRRWIFPGDYEVPADLIDNADKLKLLIDPQSGYTIRHAGVMARGIDDAVVAALGGSAAEGKYGPNAQASLIALPSAQKIAHGSTGLTIAKLIAAQEQFDEDSVDDFWTRYFVATPKQRSNLLEDDKLTSNDYNTVKALVRGEIDSFMGFQFKWVPSARLPTIASNIRGCYAYVQPAIRFGMAQPPTTSADKRPDKRNSTQIYTWGSWGAVRIEDKLVIEVACDES